MLPTNSVKYNVNRGARSKKKTMKGELFSTAFFHRTVTQRTRLRLTQLCGALYSISIRKRFTAKNFLLSHLQPACLHSLRSCGKLKRWADWRIWHEESHTDHLLLFRSRRRPLGPDLSQERAARIFSKPKGEVHIASPDENAPTGVIELESVRDRKLLALAST